MSGGKARREGNLPEKENLIDELYFKNYAAKKKPGKNRQLHKRLVRIFW